MRKFKFRAWVKPLQILSQVNELYFDGGAFVCDYDFALEAEAIELMQFTGLKDKNGVEIYEGDIVEIHSEQRGGYSSDEDRDVTWRGCVHYRPSSGFGLNMVLFMDESMDLFEKHHSLKNIVQYKSKVIGNIHENPELLN